MSGAGFADRPDCLMCWRDPAAVNGPGRECSHVLCPHRRNCWSDGIPQPRPAPAQPGSSPLDALFDEVEQ